MWIVDPSRATCAAVVAVSLVMSFGTAHAQSPERAAETPIAVAVPPEGAPDGVLADSAWEAVTGHEVQVRLVDGSVHAGLLAGYDDTSVTLIVPGGEVVGIDRREVRGVELTRADVERAAYGPAPPPAVQSDERPRGTGRIITGKVVIGVGAVQASLGLAGLLVGWGSGTDDLVPTGVSLLSWGVVHLAVGIPLLVSGRRARAEYDRRNAGSRTLSRRNFSPLVGPLRGGFTTGVALSF